MDPYLELSWRDVHAALVIYARDALQNALPGSLRARVEERVVLETPEEFRDASMYPDVRVIEWRRGASAKSSPGVAIAEPLYLSLKREPISEGYIQIIDVGSGNKVVTVIEFLSPTNKLPGPGRDQYLEKQHDILNSDANLVEINLNRVGWYTMAVDLAIIPRPQRTPYLACVRRAARKDIGEVYPLPLSKRLRVLKIPLRPDDADVALDLQGLIEQCYRNGGYEGTIDYSRDPEPPLSGGDAEWADELLRTKGMRPPRPKRKRKPNR